MAKKFTSGTAISIVVANMVGTGVFTSLGYQLADISSAPVILLLWFVGGVIALCGAFCYAELGAALPRSGGEYNFIARIFHPGAGFISGWVSATVGFAAPTALAAIVAGTYLKAVFPAVNEVLVATVLVLVVSLVHLGSRSGSSGFQLLFTGIKVLLIVLFMAAALGQVEMFQPVRWLPIASDVGVVTSGAFAIALIYVNYAYTGWNAATYLAGEVESVVQALPRILIVGTAVVTLLYVLLHVVFMAVAPMQEMVGKIEIGYIVADYAFGEVGSSLVGMMLSILLVSTISAMVLAGPRALQMIGQDYQTLRWLAKENRHGIPAAAIVFQTVVTLIMVLTSTFQTILIFASFTLATNTMITVIGVWWLRRKEPSLERPFRVPWYPLPLFIYVGLMGWTLLFVILNQPYEAVAGAVLIVVGWLFYLLTRDRVSGDNLRSEP